jgi:GNAT superfamily N-acetyltransferase
VTTITVHEGEPSSIPEALELVRAVFREHIAPLYTPEGVAELERYASDASQQHRLESGHSLFLAESQNGILGVAELRSPGHLSMLFVKTSHQRQGLGRMLLSAVLQKCRETDPSFSQLTVHASPNSVSAYNRLGFVPMDYEKEEHGIRYIPMVLRDVGSVGA